MNSFQTSTSTRLFDWELSHPILVASGPLGAHANAINKLFSLGASAVVTKTISPHPDLRHGGLVRYDQSLFNRDGYSNRSIDEWETDLELLRGKKIIANLVAETPDQLAQLARQVVAKGVKVIELGLSCPTTGNDPICCDPEQLGEFCRTVRKAVDVPIVAKVLLQMSATHNRKIALTIQNAGIDGISISDTLPSIVLDAYTGNMILGGPGGFSSPALKPLVLKALYDLADINLVIIGIGGISNGQDVIDYIRMGATAVQTCSFLIKNKIHAMDSLLKDLSFQTNKANINLRNLTGNLWEDGVNVTD